MRTPLLNMITIEKSSGVKAHRQELGQVWPSYEVHAMKESWPLPHCDKYITPKSANLRGLAWE